MDSEKEQEIFLRSLRAFSEACEPPALTPDCPFSVETEPGIRGCGEECMEILAQHNAPPPSEEIDLGGGLTIRKARRPRPRRPSVPSPKPYDGREMYLTDQVLPPRQWRLASVLHCLIEEICTPPNDDEVEAERRRQRIDEMLRLADARGLTVESQVVPHLRIVVVGAISVAVLGSLRDGGRPRSLEPWAQFASAPTSETAAEVETLGKAVDVLFAHVAAWATSASYEELVAWKCPPPSLPSMEASLPPPPEVDSDGRWIIDRFTETYLHAWSTESLKREWQYLHGQHLAPCSKDEMSAREVSERDLSLAMADRLVATKDSDGLRGAQMVLSAVGFLREGRRVEAAALFEAIARRSPNDPDALNNLGFCRLPDDARSALANLNEARDLAGADQDLIDVNRLVAFLVLGRTTSAIDLGTRLCSELPAQPRGRTYLWEPASLMDSAMEPHLVQTTDLRGYVEQAMRLLPS